MKSRKLFFTLLLIAIISFGCSKSEENVTLRFDWFTSMTFSGEIWGAQEFAEKYNLDLALEPGSETTDPIKLVLTGANDFGCISVEKLLLANQKGANLVALGVINQLSPTVFLSKEGSDITEPSDWAEERVGVLPGGATVYVYRALLRKTNISSEDFTEITVPFDLGTFISGQYDVRPAFIYDEPISLQAQGIEYNMIEPKNYGVNFVGRVYFTTKEMVEQNPEIVQDFINTMADGWNATVDNPKEAVDHLIKFDSSIDSTRALASLKKAIPYFTDENGKVLTFNHEYWNQTVKELNKLGILKSSDWQGYINDTFVNNYYKEVAADGEKNRKKSQE